MLIFDIRLNFVRYLIGVELEKKMNKKYKMNVILEILGFDKLIFLISDRPYYEYCGSIEES